MPAKPYREPQDHCLEDARQIEVGQQFVAELRRREDVDEVEQQLLESHARMMAVEVAKQRMVTGGGCVVHRVRLHRAKPI